MTPAPSGKDAKWRGRHFAYFDMDIKYFAKLEVNFPSPLFKSSQNGVRAILRVQGRALPPTAKVI